MKVVVARLKESGHKLTPPRVAALEVLIDSSEHISAEELHSKIKSKYPGAGLATTYRTLELLKELDIVTSLDDKRGKKLYEMKTRDHSHLICRSCGDVTEIEADSSAKKKAEVGQRYGFEVVDCQVEYHGICADCLHTKEED